jgi:hypothetical protein
MTTPHCTALPAPDGLALADPTQQMLLAAFTPQTRRRNRCERRAGFSTLSGDGGR